LSNAKPPAAPARHHHRAHAEAASIRGPLSWPPMGTRSARLAAAVLDCPVRLACYGGSVTQAAHLSAKIAPEAATDTHPPNFTTHPPPPPPALTGGFFLFDSTGKKYFFYFSIFYIDIVL